VPAQGEPSPVKVKSVSNRSIAESSAATGVCTGLKSSTFIVVLHTPRNFVETKSVLIKTRLESMKNLKLKTH
jgi:hypothetical protein